jgi:hypothetical protein
MFSVSDDPGQFKRLPVVESITFTHNQLGEPLIHILHRGFKTFFMPGIQSGLPVKVIDL